jgi:hypothetical protein
MVLRDFSLYRKQGKYTEAKRFYKKAIEAGDKTVERYKEIGNQVEVKKLETY